MFGIAIFKELSFLKRQKPCFGFVGVSSFLENASFNIFAVRTTYLLGCHYPKYPLSYNPSLSLRFISPILSHHFLLQHAAALTTVDPPLVSTVFAAKS
jgi:hypothetical protein